MFSPAVSNSSSCSTSSVAFDIVSILNFDWSGRCVWYLVLIWFSFEMIHVEHLFICLFTVLFIIFGEVSVKFFGPFLNRVVYYWVLRFLWIFWIIIFHHMCLLKILSPCLWLVFLFPWHCLSLLSFLIHAILIIIALMPLTDNSNICVHSWSVLIDNFFSLILCRVFLLLHVPGNFILNDRLCKYYFVVAGYFGHPLNILELCSET